MTVPQELDELLKQVAEGGRRFNQLAPGKQRCIIHYLYNIFER